MAENVVVVFHPLGARILHGVDASKYPHALVNPSFPSGVPPHYWKNVDGKICEMTSLEKQLRETQINEAHVAKIRALVTDGPIPRAEPVAPPVLKKPALFSWKQYALIAGTSVLSSFLFEIARLLIHLP